jgi:hypothetical protein
MMALIIFLLPTLAMYYFLAFVRLVVSVLAFQLMLLATQIILVDFPFYLIGLVYAEKFILPNGVEL